MTANLKRLFASCAFLPLVACTMVAAEPGAPHAVEDGQQYVLHPGEQVAVASHGRVRYLRLVNDSRCRPDVQCVWAGDAEVAFEWSPPQGRKQTFSLHTGTAPRDQAIGTRRLTLVSLARGAAPAATVRVDPTAAP
jgi:hypothetical protein